MAEVDHPGGRGHDWQVRAQEIKEAANWTCERCGKQRGKTANSYITIQTHHIVKGKKLPIPEARIDANLTAVCISCHNSLERQPHEQQFREIGRDGYAAVIQHLKEGRCTPHYLSELCGLGLLRVYGILEDLARLNLARQLHGFLYEFVEEPE